MRILFTGMGSHHCKRPENTSFFTVLSDALSTFAEVFWMSPNVSWTYQDLDKFDLVIFGLMPPTSLSANKLYGAMNVLGLMFDSPKLKIVVDSPQVWQYKNSISAVTRDPGLLLGKAYEKREGYSAAKSNTSILERAAAHMLVSPWPEILYPSLPWNSKEIVASALKFVDAPEITPINLDALILEPELPRIGRKDFWSIENPKNSWVESLDKVTVFPRTPTKLGRKTDDSYALEVVKESMGLLLPPQERNMITWWNYRMIQALNTQTPVVTYWPATQKFDPSWAMIAYQVEDMSPVERQHLAARQRDSYMQGIYTYDETLESLKNNLIDSTKERI